MSAEHGGTTSVRPATPADHVHFARLVPELAVDDPVPDAEWFAREIVPLMIVAERDGDAIGYAFYRLLEGTAHLIHLVVDPKARRTGAGSLLMSAVRERARTGGATTWFLNVKPENTGAIALYESFGFAVLFHSKALRMAWSAVLALPEGDDDVRVRALEPADEARAERELGIPKGTLGKLRSLGGRAIVIAEGREGSLEGAAVFDPKFPGTYPFRASGPAVAAHILKAFHPSRRPEDPHLNIATEGQPHVADALVAAGARVHVATMRMTASL